MKKSLKDLTGMRFSRLMVMRQAPRVNKRTRWFCLCDCGDPVIVRADMLLCGNTKSCGCLYRKYSNALAQLQSGGLEVPSVQRASEYYAWCSMIARCENKTNKSYGRYGGRGIAVCKEWRNDFPAFLDHVGPKPSKAHSLDRIDNNGNYEPGNVRWATRREQANNRRNSIFIKYKGKNTTLIEAVRAVGAIPYRTAHRRLRAGWSVDRAIETPRLW